MTFAVIATWTDRGVFDDAYVCADVVAKWHAQTARERGFTVKVRRGFKTEKSAYATIEKDYPK